MLASANVFAISVVPETTAIHLFEPSTLNGAPGAGAPVALVNVRVMFCADPRVNVATRDRLSRCMSYLAATMLACTASAVASVEDPDVITPS